MYKMMKYVSKKTLSIYILITSILRVYYLSVPLVSMMLLLSRFVHALPTGYALVSSLIMPWLCLVKGHSLGCSPRFKGAPLQ